MVFQTTLKSKSVTLNSPENKAPSYLKYLPYAVFISWVILSFAYTLSPALLSISLILLCIPGLLMFRHTPLSRSEKLLMLVFVLYYAGSLISLFYSLNQSEAIRKLVLKLPVLFFPLILISMKLCSAEIKSRMTQGFQIAIYIPAVVSVYNYFLNKKLFDQLILESKPLPVEFGYGIYHIQFSILLAASVLIGVYLFLKRKQFLFSRLSVRVNAILTLLNLIFIHILSARTGLLALYAGLAVLAFTEGSRLNLKLKLAGLIAAFAVPALMLTFSTSLQNRLSNTIEDLKVVWAGKNANDYSFAMRVQAWKNATEVIGKYPASGVGIGDADSVLKQNFAVSNPAIEIHNRKNPHFQFLETAVQSGLITAFLFLAIPFIILFGKKGTALASSIAIMFLLASCFESILERQASVIAFATLIAFALAFEKEKNTI